MLDLIDAGLGRMNLIVRRLLTLAREHVIRPVSASIVQLVERAVAAEQQRADERGVRIMMHNTSSCDTTLVDEPLIEQVFVNLIHNAIDSMPAGGDLTIDVRDAPGVARPAGSEGATGICVDVADTGAGIDPSIRPHIFEPFFTTKPGGKGTGLGLPIAARILDAHHGSISVAPRPAGGTVFTVCLPGLSAADRSAPAAHSDPALASVESSA
jgi:signal transduction histidine kinase